MFRRPRHIPLHLERVIRATPHRAECARVYRLNDGRVLVEVWEDGLRFNKVAVASMQAALDVCAQTRRFPLLSRGFPPVAAVMGAV
ncbi:MAG: hypothetical protein KKA05_10260 [Alphaproteobacteria bacterium]|nr:hypothetical protein [Alphaproteobacteria bacterium]